MFKQDRYTLINSWFRIILEGYLNFLIASLLCFGTPSLIPEMTLADRVNYVSAIITMVMLVAFTFLLFWFAMYQFRQPIKEEKLKQTLERSRNMLLFYESLKSKKKEKSSFKIEESSSENSFKTETISSDIEKGQIKQVDNQKVNN